MDKEKESYDAVDIMSSSIHRTGLVTEKISSATVGQNNKDNIVKKTARQVQKKTVTRRKQNEDSKSEPDVDIKIKSNATNKQTVSKSLLGLSDKKKDRSGLLGKNTISPIKKRRDMKGLKNDSSNKSTTAGSYTPAELMKDAIKKMKMEEYTQSKMPKEKASLLGKSPVQMALSIMEFFIHACIKVVSKGVLAILSLIAPYIVIVGIVMLLFISIIGGDRLSRVDINTQYESKGEQETVIPGVVDGIRTSLTYAEVHAIPWYSSLSPFSGDIGLDKIAGDRGGNCTAYAWGRRCEIEGQRTQLGANGNAWYWYEREVSAGIYQCGQTARVGAVCCWSYASGPGHVAIIEKINNDGSIVVSNSAYGSSTGIPVLFYITTYKSEADLKEAYYQFNGYIYLEKALDNAEGSMPDVEGGVKKK